MFSIQDSVSAMAKSWNVLNWNIRGINDSKKWLALSNKIAESAYDILCLQETKKGHFDSHFLKNFCHKKLNKFDFIPLIGASGGLLVVWNKQVFGGLTIHKNEFSISIDFTSKHSGEHILLTNVYGPCQNPARSDFFNWFQDFQIEDDVNWLVLGDFNYVRYPHNRNRSGGNIQDMYSFNEAFNKLALIEIPLKGRNFT